MLLESGAITPAEIAKAVNSVLASTEFANSKRLRRFLSYIVENFIAGESGVKEYNIAIAAYDRDPSFDPATDTIVRVEARRLRQQLTAYYNGNGLSDPVTIEIPKGGYAPVFRRREPASPPPGRWPVWAVAGLAILVSMVVAGVALQRAGILPGARIPHSWRLEGSTFEVFDAEARLCWEKHFPGTEVFNDPLVVDKALVFDIDGDGRLEVLLNLPSQAGSPGSLLCYDQQGRLRWQHRYGEPRNFGGRSFDASYRARLLRPVQVSGRRLLLTVANHYLWHPGQVALLDPGDGHTLEVYWHPGSIYYLEIRDINGDGAPEAVFAAINNPGPGLGHPAVGVLTLPFSRAPRQSSTSALTGGGELKYVLLPLPDVARVMGVLPIPTSFKLEQNRIVTETPVGETGGIVYTLDFDLNMVECRFSDNFAALHQRYYLQHLLDHPLSGAESASLEKVVRFPAAPDGNSPELGSYWKW